ncbi:MAG TPA: family 1 glycosylhydrolase [Rhodocyclaceae bacterium]|nr:family 1 glycosylhydrolase [Rhodocyclaceae bacterium]
MNKSRNWPSVELWGGVECTVARVGDRYIDQVVATGHQDRISDLDRFAALGLKAMRYPVLWERIAPDRPDRCDWSWTDERLARLRDLGIRPILGLVHHGSGPRYTSLADPGFARGLAEFAARVAERYPWAEDWTPVNEPLTTARFSGLYGHWYPHGRDARTFFRLLMNELEGTRLAMDAIRAVNPLARLIQTDDLGRTWATPPLQYQADFENERRWLGWDLLTGGVGADHPLLDYLLGNGITEEELADWQANPCPPDIIGINHYLSSERFLDHRMDSYEEGKRGGNGRDRYADVEAHRVVVDGCAGPEGLLREAWERYGLPIAVTEAHNGCTRDEQMRWFAEVWAAAVRLKAEGMDIRAVTAWSLLGATDWNSMLTRQDGFYEPGVFDIRGPEPRPTAMVGLLQELGRTGDSDHPILDSPGWWIRHDRLQYPPVRCRPLVHPLPPPSFTGKRRSLVIVGARGTLGQALARACVIRALPHHLLGRETVDIADPHLVARVLAELRPWAVINAAGCVNVDLAEKETERCWRDNCTGPRTLAAACAEVGIPMVTFSSDLVFDGGKDGPYLESDEVAPLNVYGHSKAAAEAAVLGRHRDALVIRTSAFFGPWDRYNFAVHTLARLKAGEEVPAVEGFAVSPTYVPDLVDHTLDLLIDGEAGVWHLANRGGITWHDFARALAEAWKLDHGLILPATPAEAGWIAARPANSVLASGRGDIMPGFDSAFARFVDALRGQGELPSLATGILADPRPTRLAWRRSG